MPKYDVRTIHVIERYWTLEATDPAEACKIVNAVILENVEPEPDYPDSDEIDMQWRTPMNELAGWVEYAQAVPDA